jgi:hypothetical protein
MRRKIMGTIHLRYRYLCGGALLAIGFGLVAGQPVTAAPLGLGASAIPAADWRRKIAEVEAEKASDYLRKQAAADAEKKALLDRLSQPSGVSDEERMNRAATIIKRAVDNGLTEVLVGRFPNRLCTDRGRAINQQEPGWEDTLTGLPKELLLFWREYLQPRGYKIKVEIIHFPGGMPGDVGMTLSWS